MKNNYIVKGDITEVEVVSGVYGKFTVLIDSEDFSKFKNKSIVPKPKGKNGIIKMYFVVYVKRKAVALHRFILDYNGPYLIDHINRSTYDNRKANLRIGTSTQNQQNRSIGTNNISGTTGVSWNKKRQKWAASIQIDEKQVSQFFNTKEEAINARIKMELEYYEWSPLKTPK